MTHSPQVRRSNGRHWVGDGFPVHTLFSYAEAEAVSPFLMLDYAPPTHFSPSRHPRGVGPHPHRGFETVTLVYAGEVTHRDSAGNGGTIGAGDVQWMTAAAGLVHEERHSAAFTARGGDMEMVQLWVNLPAREKLSPPRYQELRDAAMPRVRLPHGEGTVRVLAGTFDAATGPARTVTPISVWDAHLAAGAAVPLPTDPALTRMVLVRRGELTFTTDGGGEQRVRAGELVRLPRGVDAAPLRAALPDTECLVLGGEVIAEPVVGHGPFVMNHRSEIETAIRDFHAGRMGALEF